MPSEVPLWDVHTQVIPALRPCWDALCSNRAKYEHRKIHGEDEALAQPCQALSVQKACSLKAEHRPARDEALLTESIPCQGALKGTNLRGQAEPCR